MKIFAAFLIGMTFFTAGAVAEGKPRLIRVFVALCDNKTQGIMPVGEKIGNGDLPDANLYWGCSDGLGAFFRSSKQWKVTESESNVSHAILRRLTLMHSDGKTRLTADAYRGSEMRQCIQDFEAAAASGQFDLVAFIGHNGLMDFQLESPAAVVGNATEVVVLCCLSERYFSSRLTAMGCRPILMTQQLMYPGAFILHTAIERWRSGASATEIREAAASVYARNQKISVRAARGVFSEPETK